MDQKQITVEIWFIVAKTILCMVSAMFLIVQAMDFVRAEPDDHPALLQEVIKDVEDAARLDQYSLGNVHHEVIPDLSIAEGALERSRRRGTWSYPLAAEAPPTGWKTRVDAQLHLNIWMRASLQPPSWVKSP